MVSPSNTWAMFAALAGGDVASRAITAAPTPTRFTMMSLRRLNQDSPGSGRGDGGPAAQHRTARTAALLRLAVDPARGVGEDRAVPSRPLQRGRDARHLRAPVARFRRQNPAGDRLRSRTSCGLSAD